MEIPNAFNYKASVPDISEVIRYSGFKVASDLNCMRIATVEEVHYEDLTVTVRLLNKKTLGQNPDGTPKVTDYALIRAKICYCCPFITFPISVGDDCVLLFSDRELESWFINGNAQPISYQRMHDLTDAFAIFGIRSLPRMIEIMQNALHLNYSKVIAENFHAGNGVSGTFVGKDNKTITVVDGIIVNMTGGGGDPSITADEVIDALGYTPANTELSNLETTGKAVIDGQWVDAYLEIVSNDTNMTAGWSHDYSVSSYLPNDNHSYEVLVGAVGQSSATSGQTLDVRIGSDIVGKDGSNKALMFLLRITPRTNARVQTNGCVVLPVGTGRQIKIQALTNPGILSSLRVFGYRRIGTNT